MTPKPDLFRYATELDAMHGKTPHFDDGTPFEFDTFRHGTPTAEKLARVAGPVEAKNADPELFQRWTGDTLRFYFWSGDGDTFHGSIEVALDLEPVTTPIRGTVERVEAAA